MTAVTSASEDPPHRLAGLWEDQVLAGPFDKPGGLVPAVSSQVGPHVPFLMAVIPRPVEAPSGFAGLYTGEEVTPA